MSEPQPSTTGFVGRRTHKLTKVAMALAITLAIAVLTAACSSDTPTDEQTIEEVADELLAETTEDLDIDARSADIAEALRDIGATSLATMIETIDFDELTDSDEFTFFAPNDDAFLALSADEAADLLSDPDEIVRILRTHVASERIDAEQLSTLSSIETEAGTSLDVVATGDSITVGGATVTTTDVAGAGGLVHIIDTILMP